MKDTLCVNWQPDDQKLLRNLPDASFLLVQLGISSRDLDLLTIGMVNDMYAESSNDEYKGYAQIATQRMHLDLKAIGILMHFSKFMCLI